MILELAWWAIMGSVFGISCITWLIAERRRYMKKTCWWKTYALTLEEEYCRAVPKETQRGVCSLIDEAERKLKESRQ